MKDKIPWIADGEAVHLRCPLCGEWIPLYTDRNGNPYGFCKNCGLQLHIHLSLGVRILQDAIERNDEDVKTEIPTLYKEVTT